MYFQDDQIKSLSDIANGVPGKVTVGDIDADGYPDILLTGKITREGVDITQTAIFMNSAVTLPASNSLGSSNNGLTKESRREFVESTGDYKI